MERDLVFGSRRQEYRESLDGSGGYYSLLGRRLCGSSGATVQHCKGVTLIRDLKLKFASSLDYAFVRLISFIVSKHQFLHTTLTVQVFSILAFHLLIN